MAIFIYGAAPASAGFNPRGVPAPVGTIGVAQGAVLGAFQIRPPMPRGGVYLQDAALLGFERQPVYDAHTYIWTRVRVHVRGVFNPVATSYTFAGVASGTGTDPVFRSRQVPAFTDRAIRHALAQPRRQLYLEAGGTVLLYCPAVGEVCDADSGPKLVGNPIVQALGDKSFLVDVHYECCVNECELFNTTASSMLAHSFSVRESIDQDFYSTITIDGHAIFHRGRLLGNAANQPGLGVVPHDFLAYLAHPVRPGFQRIDVQVDAPEGGNELRYRTTDREKSHTFLRSRGVTRIEATHSATTTKPNLEEYGLMAMERAAGRLAGAAGIAAGAAGAVAKGGATAAGFAGQASGMGFGIINDAVGMIPRVRHVLCARVWGDRTARRDNLELVARAVCEARIAGSQLPGVAWWTLRNLTHDLSGKFVEAVAWCEVGPISGAGVAVLRGLQSIFGANKPTIFDRWPGIDSSEVVQTDRAGIIIRPGAGDNPGGPRPVARGKNVAVHGGLVGRIAATALLGACGTPPEQVLATASEGGGGYTTTIPPQNDQPP